MEQLKTSFLYELINPLVQRYELAKWVFSRKPPTPHLVKQKMVRNYASKFDIKTLVETGTYLGVMVNAVKDMFDEIYSIELDKKLAERAKEKFKKDKNVQVLSGDSSKVLLGILKKLDERVLFWLDAHYSGGITARGKKETPVLDELKLIAKHNKNHVILIDDADMFGGKAGYPTLEKIRESITNLKRGYAIKIENNVFVINN